MPFPMRLRLLSLALLPGIALADGNVDTDAAGDAAGPAVLDSIVVVASRAAEPLSQVVASVAQVQRDDMERHLVRDLDGLVRYVPGIGVTTIVSAAAVFPSAGWKATACAS